MELFGLIGWISVPQSILQFIDLPAETLTELIANERLYWWITLGVGGGLYLLGLIFGGLGLTVLAKRAGIKHGWMGFFPFANTYLAGKLAGNANLFGTRVKRIGLWTMICEIVFVAVSFFSMVLELVVLDPAYWEPGAQSTATQTVYALSKDMLGAAGMGWIYTVLQYDILGIINYVFSLVVLFIFCTLFSAFYRKYYARSPFLLTFLSAVLPGRGFAIFAVRNNNPVDYDAYMRRRMQQYQQQQQPPYGGGYYGPQDGPYTPPASSAPHDEPFGDEFGTPSGGPPAQGGPSQGTPPPSDDDPFSDF